MSVGDASDGQKKPGTGVRQLAAFTTLELVKAGIKGITPPIPGVSGGNRKSIELYKAVCSM